MLWVLLFQIWCSGFLPFQIWCSEFCLLGFTVLDLVFQHSVFFCILLHAQNDKKNSVCCTPYLRKHTSYDCDFWRFFMISPGFFFIFSNIDFPDCDKKFCPSHPVSQETVHQIIVKLSWSLMHIYKLMIFPAIFFSFFQILIYWGFSREKGQKMTQNCQYQSVTLHISETVDYIIKIFGAQV